MSLINLTYTCIEQIEESFNCPICKETYKTPVMINNCSHNFCSICVRRYFSIKLECPVCGIDASQINLYPNRTLDSMVTRFKELRGYLVMIIEQINSDVQMDTSNNNDSELKATEKSNYTSPNNTSISSENTIDEDTPEFQLSLLVESQSQGFSPTLDDKLNVNQLSQHADSKDMFSNAMIKMDNAELSYDEKNIKKLHDQDISQVCKNEEMTNNKMNVESTSTYQELKNQGQISTYCPVCGCKVAASSMNKHLDMCLKREEKKESLRVKPKRKKMYDTPAITKLVYKLYSIKDLREKMKKIGLSTYGDKKEISKRHKDFLAKYQAEQDKLVPRGLPLLIREFEREEIAKKKKTEMPVTAKDANDPECKAERLKYLRKYSKQYGQLEVEAKRHSTTLKGKVNDSYETRRLDGNQFSTPTVSHSTECASDSPELIFVGPSSSESEMTSNSLKRKLEEDSQAEEIKMLINASFIHTE